jgi:nucleotide-binding universal stress UspA family protein
VSLSASGTLVHDRIHGRLGAGLIAEVRGLELAPTLAGRRIGVILLATDLGPASADAAERAISLAAQLDAELLIVSVIDAAPVFGDGLRLALRVDQVRARREPIAQALVAAAVRAGVPARFLIWDGAPGESIAAAAEAERCDLIVVGTHGRTGFERSLAGSVSDYLIRNAPCPVVVVRPNVRASATR